MHDDRDLVERRIAREIAERVLPAVHLDVVALDVTAGPSPDELTPFHVGERWGEAWGTTWFGLRGTIPDRWERASGTRVEAMIDLGFRRDPPGFQAEGLVVERADDGGFVPAQGIHPDRTAFVVEATAGPVELLVEAASNPTFPQFRPSPDGLPETAAPGPRYRFERADLVLVDVATEALVHDLDVLDGVMRSLPVDAPERARIRVALVRALDDAGDVGRARRHLRPFLSAPGEIAVTDDGTGDRRPGAHRVVATGHAHIDTAWLWPTRETIRKCTRTFASATRLMDDDPTFVFTCSQAQQYAWIEERHPELFERIRERVERGQWYPVGGMWVEADMNLPSAESLARQIVFGQRWFEERFGVRSTEMWIPDVFGYPPGLPQLFAAGGMRRFVTQKLSWNQQNRFPHHTFWWEGLDGTRILAHFPPVDTYNAMVRPQEVAASVSRFREHEWSSVSLLPFGHGDGGGGPTREMLERAHRLADRDRAFTLDIGTPADFFAAVEREVTLGASVPVWRGELYLEMHRGTLTSQLRTKVGNRRCERLLVEAELWAATLGRQAGVDDLWREVLTQQFHDILPGSSIAWVHRDAEEVFDRVAGVLEERIECLLAEVVPSGGPALANPSGVAVDGVVVVSPDGVMVGGPAPEADEAGAVSRIDTSPTGQVLADGRVAVTADVPAFGVVGLEDAVGHDATADRVVTSDTSLTNGLLAVRFGGSGDVVSIIDLVAGRELVPEGESAAVVELAADRPVEYDAWDLESWTREQGRPVGPGRIEVLDDGPLVGRIRVTREFGESRIVVDHELRAGERQLRLSVDLDWQHDEHLLSMAFPLDVRADTAACDVQLGVAHRPTHPSSPWDAAKFEVCAHRYVSVAEPSFGVAVLNDGRYGHGVFGGAVRVSLARAARYPDPDADLGRHSVTLAVRPHDGDLADVRAAAELLNRPVRLVAARTRSAEEDAGRAVGAPIVSITGRDGGPVGGVEVDAVKLADDGSGDLVVRLHEAVGDRTRISVATPGGVGAATRCNLLEEPERGEDVGDGIVALTLRPFELVTLRLTRPSPHLATRR